MWLRSWRWRWRRKKNRRIMRRWRWRWRWRKNTRRITRRRRSSRMLAETITIPKFIWNGCVVVKGNTTGVMTTVDFHSLRYPIIGSGFVKVRVTYLFCTWSFYLKFI